MNYVVLFSTQDEWGREMVEAETPLKALEEVYGAPLTEEVLINNKDQHEQKFLYEEDNNNYFTGIIIPSEKLKERVYVYKHDSEELLKFPDLLSCFKKIACSLEEAYGLEEAMEVINFLIDSTDSVLNITLESWGDTTIFIMD